ncbi:hypothetical protein QTP86_020578 [Hemibagrus guttatus]|nr:hypothetical protein QTP86_020578 [Hemibagrus guttatus]
MYFPLESHPGVLALNMGSEVILGCRGDVTVDKVLLVMGKKPKEQHKRRGDITSHWKSQKARENPDTLGKHHPETVNFTTPGTYKINTATKVSKSVTSANPAMSSPKEKVGNGKISLAVNQFTKLNSVGRVTEEGQAFSITMEMGLSTKRHTSTEYEKDEDHGEKVDGLRVTRSIKRQAQWTRNGQLIRDSVEYGGVLRIPALQLTDSGNYSCYRRGKLVSSVKISVGIPPVSPTLSCHKKSHISQIQCEWISRQPIIPQPQCYLLHRKGTNFIPDRSRPGLTTTAIGAVDLQGAGGNWATVGRRSRGGRRVRRQREKRKGKSVGLRIGTLNVGTMTGKGRELADMMERRQVDILCVQETRWKGGKARSIGAGFKLFYYGVDSKRNGVGVVLKEEFVRNVLEVKRVSDRVMSLKLEIEGVMLNVVSGYAPQVGCELEEKERFWSELDEVMENIPTGERVVIGADFNGHVGERNTGDEEVMGKFGVKERNLEGQMVVDFAKRMDMGVVNTYFQKREEHRVTYKSGGRRTQVDYILCRRGNLKEISDCKVVVGESVARQHRMVVCRMTLMVCKMKRSKIEKKTKWWKLKKEECCEEFRQKLRQALRGQVVLPDDWETTAEVIRETGRKVLGVSSGRRKEDKETWWWNEEVHDSIQRKRLAKKKWDMDRTEENKQEYKELQRRVKREVSKAKQKPYEELYTRLDTREGEKDLYRLARQRDRDGKDVQQVRVIKDRDGRVLTSEESVQRRWKEYFEELMNEENEREKRVEGVNSVEQKVDKIRKDEVRKALKRMKSGKAVGPDDIPVEVWKCLGEAAVEFLASLFNRVLESERMPEEWRRSVLVPIFKNKGDVQSCSNYRGIKLMSHTMKLWERVVEARLRKVVEFCEQQYGFMPRKSTTDAIFALRILMEKYRDGQRELHCVFVDLEKAYDRVPREELWYCMRESGVAEKYVRVVQDMYERSRTVVRCAVGQTEEFNVEVGLHQGSALSPFLFAMVMDQLSEEVRQESPWTMMFADDIVICSESREQVEENLERWRFALERREMKVSRSKTEYMFVNEREGSETVRLQGEEVKKVQEFKYLGSTVQSNGECGKEVKKRVQAGWNGWRKVSGVLCDQKISARIKGKVYRTVVRAAMLYGLETVSLRKRQESELEVAELKMLRFSLGVTRLDRIRNEYIRGTAHVGRLGDKVREARLRWFGHVQRRESEYIGRRMLDMELPGRRQRGRPKRRYMDGINEDMKLVGARVEDAEDRDRWREMIR